MTKSNCGECLYRDSCVHAVYCEHFEPLHEDALLDEYIEQERSNYYDEWFRYIDECAEDIWN